MTSPVLPALPALPALPGQRDAEAAADAAPPVPVQWLDRHRVAVLRAQWTAVQAGFVDDPREAARSADEVLGRALTLLTEQVEQARHRLRALPQGPAPTTEELRGALREYHKVLDRILIV
ncbi:hypothetical protein OG455_01610 [Kitasatospora sp. NBC_01287]|uniref:hypothetical protein n=1 Tax=Kitasatospora sp. NBC_01287 TaxID=2903573 RepID=UPI002257D63A|nr:hypothetical protein [Kitasatospora sp. NBC_01287]MCX4744222.1 hypothetical protein [Kitasatospora sp. NBC_01287]